MKAEDKEKDIDEQTMDECKIDVDNSTFERNFGLFNMTIPEKVIDLALATRGEV